MNSFDVFYANQTPANAVRLAYDDHRSANGEGGSSWAFLDALAKAEMQLRAYENLLSAVNSVLNDSRLWSGNIKKDFSLNLLRAAARKSGSA